MSNENIKLDMLKQLKPQLEAKAAELLKLPAMDNDTWHGVNIDGYELDINIHISVDDECVPPVSVIAYYVENINGVNYTDTSVFLKLDVGDEALDVELFIQAIASGAGISDANKVRVAIRRYEAGEEYSSLQSAIIDMYVTTFEYINLVKARGEKK